MFFSSFCKSWNCMCFFGYFDYIGAFCKSLFTFMLHKFQLNLTSIVITSDWQGCNIARVCGGAMDNWYIHSRRRVYKDIPKHKKHVLHSPAYSKGSSISPNKGNIRVHNLSSKFRCSVHSNFRLMGWTAATSCMGNMV